MDTTWTLVTVTFNSAHTLAHYAARTSEFEWIVVDNASMDGSADVAEGMGARVIRLKKNVGFGRANNIGLMSATGEFVGCVNPDVRVVYRDLDAAARSLDSLTRRDPGRMGHLLAPQLLYPDGTPQPNGRGVPTLARKIRNRLVDTRGPYQILAAPDEQRYVAWVTGAAVLARRSVWDQLGGWDPRFFVYYEDHDLGLRGWSRNIPTILDGSIRWVHGWARETTGAFKLRPWLLEFDGMAKFFSRYPGLVMSERYLPRRFEQARLLSGRPVSSDGVS